MVDQETRVHIVEWPEKSLRLLNEFNLDKPCPVSISFEQTPARVVVASQPGQPLDVNMNMRVTARETIPFCIKVCEPICARSDYTVAISIFDNPFASITVRGTTRLFNCKEEPPVETVCVDFLELKPGTEFAQPFLHGGLKFTPLAGPLHAATFGDPAGQVKLAFPRTGVRISFPGPVNDLSVTVNNYAGPTIDFATYSNGTLLARFSEPISNSVREVDCPGANVTDLEVSGGDNEAAIVQICYTPLKRG